MTMKEEFTKKIQEISDEVQVEFDKLKAAYEKVEDLAQVEYGEAIEKLNVKKEEAKVKLEDFQEDSGEAWEDLKDGLERSWVELKKAVKAARSHYLDETEEEEGEL